MTLKPDSKFDWPLIATRELSSACLRQGTHSWREFMEIIPTVSEPSSPKYQKESTLTVTHYLSLARTQIV